jgi:prepilin peptidase CpaA
LLLRRAGAGNDWFTKPLQLCDAVVSPGPLMSPALLTGAFLVLFAALAVVAALKDLVSYTIPNWISLALALAFTPAAFSAGLRMLDIGVCVLIGLIMLMVAITMFALRWLGGGDAKLLAAVAPWLGLSGLPAFLMFTALAGGALALLLIALRSAWVRPFAIGGPPWFDRLAQPGGATPYGVAIAVGALAALPHGVLVGAAGLIA